MHVQRSVPIGHLSTSLLPLAAGVVDGSPRARPHVPLRDRDAASAGSQQRVTMALDPRLIHLHPADNVVTAATVLLAGAPILLGGGSVTPAEPIALGFKVAAHDIAIGEKIIKWGVPIGSATAPIAAGAIVHLHNMQSDYLPTFTLDGERRYVAEHQ